MRNKYILLLSNSVVSEKSAPLYTIYYFWESISKKLKDSSSTSNTILINTLQNHQFLIYYNE